MPSNGIHNKLGVLHVEESVQRISECEWQEDVFANGR